MSQNSIKESLESKSVPAANTRSLADISKLFITFALPSLLEDVSENVSWYLCLYNVTRLLKLY